MHKKSKLQVSYINKEVVISDKEPLTTKRDGSLTPENVDVADSKVNLQPDARKGRMSVSPKQMNQCYSQLCDFLVVAFIIVIIIGLFSIPTVYFSLPTKLEEQQLECSQATDYSGKVCRNELASLQTCFSGEPSPLSISTTDQEKGENDAERLLNNLPLLNPSAECVERLRPFLCLFLFGVCDVNNRLHTILREDCLQIRDRVCATEWQTAVMFLGDGVLPVCEDLQDTTDDCIASNVSSVPDIMFSLNMSANNDNELNCTEGFFFDKNGTGVCRPSCKDFEPSSLASQIVIYGAGCIGFMASFVMFVLAFTIQRETLLVFPHVLHVYQCTTTFILSVLLIIGLIDNAGLYCGSRDLIHNTGKGNETIFCTISGVIFNYGAEQVCVWAILHAVYLYWCVAHPFSYRQLKISGRMRYAHIFSVIVALVLPLPAALVHLKDGYVVTNNPTFVCSGRNSLYTYYTFVLPVSIILAVTASLLVLVFWKIFKQFVLKKLMAKQKIGKVGKAQIKISVIVIYYILAGVMGLTALTYFEVQTNVNREGVIDFILCARDGNKDCSLSLTTINNAGVLSDVVIVMLSLLPVMAILFNFDSQACRKKLQKESPITKASSIRTSSIRTSSIRTSSIRA